MSDLIREALLGQIIRLVTRNKLLQYPEERADFVLPPEYSVYCKEEKAPSRSCSETSATTPNDLEKDDPNPVHSTDEALTTPATLSRTRSRTATVPFTEERLEIEAELALQRTVTRPIAPQKTADGTILVDWYTTDDPANPQNWSDGKRAFTALQICLYTVAVYTGSAIYTSSETGVMEAFGVSPAEASLPLSLYVLAYGIGPLLFAPLSEIAVIGRNPVYIATFALFVILSIPTALVNNFAGLLVLRFLQGFFGSPCLANGGASMQDMYSLLHLPYLMTAWVSAAYCGPALGPLLSGFAVAAQGWRWSLWEIVWMAGPVFVLLFLCLPETSTPNILLRRAQRLRKLTGNLHFKSQSEIDERDLKPSAILLSALIKPIEITIKDPAIAFVNVYSSLVYGIYYSFFEAFPIVYIGFYHFTPGTLGVAFICIIVACLIGMATYVAYLYFWLNPDIKKNGLRAQESRLQPALFAVFGPPIGLFLFAWTSRPDIHWIVSVIGITIYGASVFIVFQCIFVYVPLSYPQYAASLFAANDFCRSALACGSIIFARPLFINLGVGRGVSLLGGLSTLGIVGMFVLYFQGAKLRSRSKFAMS
ncbi:major facilitator superfamily transporter [Lasallia pustulata]|uniref:Major facilitator superfamily transporter n=1 Tax=Lasallia pustulata TaxID=136370 RepID=A0A1W5D9C0_9LECA|nr:major facilitator superfamily transporter [Lasallia pustulata]